MIKARRPLLLISAILATLLGGLAAVSECARAQPVFVREPYVQLATPRSVVVMWRTGVPTSSRVLYGSSPDNLDKAVSKGGARVDHTLYITGLQPDSRYYYAVGSTTDVYAGGNAGYWFRTAPQPGKARKFRAWVLGDSGTGGVDQRKVRDAMLAYTGRDPPDLFLHLGDMAYSSGTDFEFSFNFFSVYKDILRHTVCWPTLGNHEGKSSDSETESGPYYDAYVLPKAGEAGGAPSGTEAYYSFDFANMHFIVLDSHDSPRSKDGAMLQWLQADLAGTDQDWIVAYWHHPPYTKGSHDSDAETQLREMRENALPILEQAGVDLVLTGHSHIYERSWLVDGAYDTPTTAAGHIVDQRDGRLAGDGPYVKALGNKAHDGAVYVVAGHGGKALAREGTHPLMYFVEQEHGSLILDVQGRGLRLVNLRDDGVVSDSFALMKGPGVMVERPNGGEMLGSAQATEIRWVSTGNISKVDLHYSLDGGATWMPIAVGVPNTGTHAWTPPAKVSLDALVRVRDSGALARLDESDGSFTISEKVAATPIPWGATWSYDDRGIDHGKAWMEAGYDEAGWKQGPAELGYGDGDEATTLDDADPNIPTVYFRKVIQIPGVATSAELRILYDDGIAVWVNGSLVFGRHMGNGTAFDVFASEQSLDNERGQATLDPAVSNPFVVGENVVAVMVKQHSATSSDLSFDMEMRVGYEIEVPNIDPVLKPVGDKATKVGKSLAFQLQATDANGDPLAFGAAGLPLGADLDAATGKFNWTPTFVQVGDHKVVFKVSDGRGGEDSEEVGLRVIPLVKPPPDTGPIGDAGPAGSDPGAGSPDPGQPVDRGPGDPGPLAPSTFSGGSGCAAGTGALPGGAGALTALLLVMALAIGRRRRVSAGSSRT